MSWTLIDSGAEQQQNFANLDQIFSLQGKRITYEFYSDLIYYSCAGKNYYVKRYYSAGKGIRSFRIRPRVQAEWENTFRFAQWGIPTEKIIAYGQEKFIAYFKRGAFVSEEIPGAEDLKTLADEDSPILQDAKRVDAISQQVAKYTSTMHEHNFAHNDLKWRNILIDASDKVYFIDCPTGRFWFGPFLHYRIIKDLACLDKVAKKQLSRSQRLRFYLYYANKTRLDADDKKQIYRILGFFKK